MAAWYPSYRGGDSVLCLVLGLSVCLVRNRVRMELIIGPHRIVAEQDVLFAYTNGPWRIEEMRRFLTLSEETYARFGSLYIVTIIDRGYDLPPDSRKYIADWSRTHFITGNVIAGASLAMRTLVTLLSRASQLIGAKNPMVTFVSDEAAARAWVAEHKAQRQQGLRP